MRTSPEVTLPLKLDGDGALPVQIAAELRRLIGERVLAPGDRLPSSRALAEHLGISRGSVVACYDQLLAEGYLSSAAGKSTVVNPLLLQVHPPSRQLPSPAQAGPSEGIDLRPGRPSTTGVVGPAWKSAWRQASVGAVDAPIPHLGLATVRAAWAEHLRRMRGLVRDPAQIAVTAGGREGLALLLLALSGGRSKPLTVGVEEPGYPSLRRVPARHGATVVPLPVDEHGLRVADLPTGHDAPDLLLVTPSHQYPLGGSLPMDRRQALLEWAAGHDVVVVEDDYDSELRYTSHPLPTLTSLDDPDAGRVVLLGTLSKTLTPALAIGFLTLPARLVPVVAETRADLGQPVGLVAQRAVAGYLTSGALRLHTQRMRQLYRRRRAKVVGALSGVPGIRVHPMDGGLHAVVETSHDESRIVEQLASAGVRVSPLSRYWSGAGNAGIVFGFGAVTEAELERGLALIRDLCATHDAEE
ncbi:GntR family transcriptional regulator / MocR family aminotransferase [Tessaracoccus bendigoensis DSM 12906]|uniref:GntR family transcriptional regulator / MocR family aminotransferase n=1 Tax=Tessaracoccus bendigoensis DSM 12906 TaxID=1123357 RepID=A0A1M6HXD8_9ACTN|nr:PLP-dependent aminotransferase family protein [Tessaracoccus bendigoensis]SHJ26902.1 GntR family transcriptional regulator / MocR family aminotransferase [Tessaracoccus bendigoensis DSM 12906]